MYIYGYIYTYIHKLGGGTSSCARPEEVGGKCTGPTLRSSATKNPPVSRSWGRTRMHLSRPIPAAGGNMDRCSPRRENRSLPLDAACRVKSLRSSYTGLYPQTATHRASAFATRRVAESATQRASKSRRPMASAGGDMDRCSPRREKRSLPLEAACHTMAPPQGKRAPRVGHICIVILAREAPWEETWTAAVRAAKSALCLSTPPAWATLQINENIDRCRPRRNYFTEICSGSEAGSYLRLIDFCITQL